MQHFFGFVGARQSPAPEENEALWDLPITNHPERKGWEISRSRSAWTPYMGDPFLKTQNQQPLQQTNKRKAKEGERTKRRLQKGGVREFDLVKGTTKLEKHSLPHVPSSTATPQCLASRNAKHNQKGR